ncbi:MAG: penicillin-binding protein 2 [Candidatus Bipolaricaulis sp.]|nr:penicillin-binding protein 2 [Candidatus Bipolaricaulis sp.]
MIVLRLVELQIIEHGSWVRAAAAMQEKVVDVWPRRGAIYDRDGAVLAFDVKAVAIAVDSYNMTRPVELVEILTRELRMSVAEISERVYRASYFTWIDRQVDLETARRIETQADEAGAYGLIFLDAWKRFYPQGRLASNVLGFVGADGEGLEGLELTHDEVLRGTPTRVRIVAGADGRTYSSDVIEEGRPGRDLHLTLDAGLQFVCEDEIEKSVGRLQAASGMIVVLEPKTGEILAMAQDKGYNLNRFWVSTPAQRRNLALTFMFEPGSVFKVFSGLAALEAGTVAPGDWFNGNDGIQIGGHTIHNADNWSYGTITFAQVIADSVNTAMVRVGLDLGKERLHKALVSFGFGAATGVELPGEAKGILRDAKQWSDLDLACTSYGQSIAVTAIQLARGLAIVANGGVLVAPHVLLPDGGNARQAKAADSRAVLSERTCATMKDLMVGVVKHGTGTYAAVEGFSVAGKTGTAQKAVAGKGYASGKYTSLFGGFLPAEDPAYVIMVILDEVGYGPVGGGATAGPVFSSVATRWARMGELIPVAGL